MINKQASKQKYLFMVFYIEATLLLLPVSNKKIFDKVLCIPKNLIIVFISLEISGENDLQQCDALQKMYLKLTGSF
jgi:hypothetical protein